MDSYKYLFNRDGVTINQTCIAKNGVLVIPFDPANMDYVDYLKWVAEGNTPLPAEETP